MSVINVNEVTQQAGRPTLPKQVYSLRITAIEKRTSGNNNEMLSYELEFCSPESVKPIGASEAVKIAGLSFKSQITFHGKNNMPLVELKGLCAAAKASTQVDLDDAAFLRENFLGKGVRAEIKTEAKTLTQMDENGNVVPVMDNNGLPIVDNNYKVARWIGADDRFTIPASAIAY